jgi:dynein heavy chain
MPGARTHHEFLQVIEDLPLVAGPEIFGFHENANITKSSKETNDLLVAILLTEGGGSSSGDTESIDNQISTTAQDILLKLPAAFDIEAAQIKYPVTWNESMNTVLCQELVKFNNLTNLIKFSLNSVLKAVKGIVVMSSALEKLGSSLIYGSIPLMWKPKSYPSFKPLAGYIQDLLSRLDFMHKWVDDRPPPTYWISAFFFQHAFMTASKQNYARSQTIPIDAIGFQFEMLGASECTRPPNVGVYCFGLFFEGARWCRVQSTLAESEPKILYSLSPLLWFQPKRDSEIQHPPSYTCPVYKTADRRGILATTGHSTNFILDILVPSSSPESHWVQRGVALLSQLDD